MLPREKNNNNNLLLRRSAGCCYATAGKPADVWHRYSSWSECCVVFGFKLAAPVASLFPDFKSLALLERKKSVRNTVAPPQQRETQGVAVHGWLTLFKHSFIGRWQGAQGKSPLRAPAFKTLTHVGVPESLSLMFWLFIYFSLYPAKANFSCKTEVHPQHSPCSLLCRSRTFFFTWERSQQPSAGSISFMFFFPSAENAPRLCSLPSLNECRSHCVGHRLIEICCWLSHRVSLQSCPPGEAPLPVVLLG